MRILIIYYMEVSTDRETINEHLYSFRKYSGELCYYLNMAYGIPRYLHQIYFDLIVYHYSCFGFKIAGNDAIERQMKTYWPLRRLVGYKVAIPQDECVNSVAVCGFFREFGIKTVFTCLPPTEWETVYPRETSGLEHYVTVLTGYVDPGAVARRSASVKAHRARPIDLGHRARKVPYWLGRHGLMKWQLTEVFSDAPRHAMNFDLSNEAKDVFYGESWYQFLGDCRVVLGCEGGASLHDPHGDIKARVDDYVSRHPRAAFDEVQGQCFPGVDGNLRLFALSPRHFEACITRTCQALVEGEYSGIFKPGVHYIEIKRDWSNVQQVIEIIRDVDLCEHIADNAYNDIIKSGLFTYREFVRSVTNHVREVHHINATCAREPVALRFLSLRDDCPWLFSPGTFAVNHLCRIVRNILIKVNLYESYNRLRNRG